jgi:flagella basal body P-ring formation protein FlgA
MRRFLLPLICVCPLALPGPARAASLREVSTLAAPVVRLSDLFDDAGPSASRVLGTAPAPGTRLVVEAAQLAAIARQFGVAWRPNSPADRVVLDRPGRMLPREAVVSALRGALALLGTSDDLEIDLPGFTAPVVPQEGEAQASVDQLDYNSVSGRFTALLSVTAEGMAVHRERLSGHVEEMLELPVLPRRIAVGAVIEPADTKMARVRAGQVRGEVARAADQMVGFALRRPVAPGQPVALADLMRPNAVLKGGHVSIELQAPGLALAAQGMALESGAIGERIKVLNPGTRATIIAEVIAPEQVRVTPAAPINVTAQPGPLVATR